MSLENMLGQVQKMASAAQNLAIRRFHVSICLDAWPKFEMTFMKSELILNSADDCPLGRPLACTP